MKKQEIAIAVVIALVAIGVMIYGRTTTTPKDGVMKASEILGMRQVPVVVITEGRGGASGEFLSGIKQAIAGLERVKVVHVDSQNPLEREAMARFDARQLPAVIVIGLDGASTYASKGSFDAQALQEGVREGLTKTPPPPEESGGHHH